MGYPFFPFILSKQQPNTRCANVFAFFSRAVHKLIEKYRNQKKTAAKHQPLYCTHWLIRSWILNCHSDNACWLALWNRLHNAVRLLQWQSDVHVAETRRNVHHLEITVPPLSRPSSCFSTYSSSSQLYTCLSVPKVVSSSSAMRSLAPPAACLPQCGPPCLAAWLPHVPCPPLTQACVLTPTNQRAVTQRHASCFFFYSPAPPQFSL